MATLLSGRAMDDKPVAPASPWQPWYPDGQQRFLLMAVILDVGTKPLQRHVPTRRNLLEIVAEFCELLRLNLPQAISPDAITAHETNILKHAEMLGNGLTRNTGALLQPDGWERPIRT